MKTLKLAQQRVNKAQTEYDSASVDQLIAHLRFESAKDKLDEAKDDLKLIELYGDEDRV